MNDITITQKDKRYSALHPCSKHTIFLGGTTWRSVIHYYYGQQLNDGQLIYKILLADTADAACAIASRATAEQRKTWSLQTARETIHAAYHAKVMQYAVVRGALLRTGDSRLVMELADCGKWRDDSAFAEGTLLSDSLVRIRDDLTKDGPFDELKTPRVPPWLKYPDIPAYSIGWRMGNGEAYASEFYSWYRGLTVEGRKKYKTMYPPPKGWK